MDNISHKNFFDEDIVKKLGPLTTPHPHPYNISWMKDGQKLRITWQCRLSYFIKPFEDEVLYGLAPLSITDNPFGKSYLWDRHRRYQSRHYKVILKIRIKWYGIPERQPTSMVAIIYSKETKKLINHAQKFTLIMIKPQHSRKTTTTH